MINQYIWILLTVFCLYLLLQYPSGFRTLCLYFRDLDLPITSDCLFWLRYCVVVRIQFLRMEIINETGNESSPEHLIHFQVYYFYCEKEGVIFFYMYMSFAKWFQSKTMVGTGAQSVSENMISLPVFVGDRIVWWFVMLFFYTYIFVLLFLHTGCSLNVSLQCFGSQLLSLGDVKL